MSDELRAAVDHLLAELQDSGAIGRDVSVVAVRNVRQALTTAPAARPAERVISAAKRVRAAWDNDKNLGRDKYMLRLADEFIELEDALDTLDGGE